jgi:uncharacterized repeat protein (TIGR01451 family)
MTMTKTTKAILFISMLFIIPVGLLAQAITITGDSTINQCETKTYTISIQNNSGNPLTNLVITALLQNFTGFSYVNGTTGIDVLADAPRIQPFPGVIPVHARLPLPRLT